jgi:hypothetical protein
MPPPCARGSRGDRQETFFRSRVTGGCGVAGTGNAPCQTPS